MTTTTGTTLPIELRCRGEMELAIFAEAMLNEMRCNAHKDDWKALPLTKHGYEVMYHAAKLCIALRERHEVAILEYAADVANAAMHATDASGALETFLLNGSRAEIQPGVTWRREIPRLKRRCAAFTKDLMGERAPRRSLKSIIRAMTR